MIGDVAGTGTEAAAVTSLVRHTAWTASEFDSRPAQVLERVDAALKRNPSLWVCTALCMRLSQGQGTIAAGGHPLPFCLSADGVRELGTSGTLLGAFARAKWPEAPFALRPGDAVVAITDGVTDTVGGDGERFGMTRLQKILAELPDHAPRAIARELEAALDDFQVGPQADDTAVVAMRFTGASPESPRANGAGSRDARGEK
jgi:sigma-B regulation protein RsbU (phosphoserine phosphatase)